MLTDGWKYTVRAYYPISAGGGLAWHKSFGTGGARDAELMACAMQIQSGALGMVAVTSRVQPWRRTQKFENASSVQAWVQRIGASLR